MEKAPVTGLFFGCSQSNLRLITQSCLRASAAKLFGMQSIGELAKAFRKARGWSYTRMAQEVQKHGGSAAVSGQAIT